MKLGKEFVNFEKMISLGDKKKVAFFTKDSEWRLRSVSFTEASNLPLYKLQSDMWRKKITWTCERIRKRKEKLLWDVLEKINLMSLHAANLILHRESG